MSHILSHKTSLMPYVITRNGWKHFKKRIPTCYRSFYPPQLKYIQVPLKTDSDVVAQQRALAFNAELKSFWQRTYNPDTVTNSTQLQHLIKTAQRCGFAYRPTEAIAEGDLSEIIQRTLSLDTENTITHETVGAVLGKEPLPSLSISQALDEYLDFEIPNLINKNESQIRRWKNPRKKAIRNFVDLCGDKSVEDISREDILTLRSWWQVRLDGDKPLCANSANKNLAHLKIVLCFAEDHHQLDLHIEQLFIRTKFREIQSQRPPFETDYIRNTLLNPVKLSGLHEECRWFLYAMADTGARPSELLGLNMDDGDIRLDVDIPYIHIRPSKNRSLKTPQSERKIPLVGSSLLAFKNLPNGFQKYYLSADSLSANLNKYLRMNKLLPTDKHCVYSLRHSFEDRLTAVEPPEKVQALLMGHKYGRTRYGDGPSLEQKKVWLDKIAFEFL